MEDYKLWLLEEGKSLNTVNRYIRIASDFIDWHNETSGQRVFQPHAVSALDLQDWKFYLLNDAIYKRSNDGREQKYSIASVNNYLKGIRSYFDFLVQSGLIDFNPALKLKAQKIQDDEDEPRWLDRAERSRFILYINNEKLIRKNAWRYLRNRAIALVMLLAGLRVSEVAELELDQLEFEAKNVHVRSGKGGKSRNVPMNPDLLSALNDWLKVRGNSKTKKVFVSQRGGGLSADGMQHVIEMMRDKTGIPDLTAHVLRHTFAHDLAERGEALQTIADLLGHSNINYTRRYVTSNRKERIAAVNKLSGER